MSQDACCFVAGGEEKWMGKVREHLDALIQKSGEVHYKKGQILFYEGHYPHGFFVVKKGEVSLFQTTLFGNHKDLESTQDNVLGLYHLITNTTHCATAQATTNVIVTFIPKSLVIDFLK